MSVLSKRKILWFSKKAGVAIGVALLFVLLGVCEGIGYQICHINEVSFIPLVGVGHADATFECDILYNPIVYPYYWIVGNGYINGTFAIIYIPNAIDSFGRAHYDNPRDRYTSYTIRMITWGLLPNLVALLFITVFIEIINIRSIHIVLLSGIAGFWSRGILGLVIGIILGASSLILLLRVWHDNPVVRFWNSIQKPQQLPTTDPS